MNILVLNAGSSSLKYQLINMDQKIVLGKGCGERIGIDGKFSCSTYDGRCYDRKVDLSSHSDAFQMALKVLMAGNCAVIHEKNEINAVGHRIVNGGERFQTSELVTPRALKDLADVLDLAPLHNPPAYELIKTCLKYLGENVPNVLVFDTTFYHTMPPKSYVFGLPYQYYEKYKLRRYGAHGTSHRFVCQRCADLMGKDLSKVKMVTCHLGNGSSLSAIDHGKCIDTSMGFTPLGGLIMGSRSGDIDPSAITFLMEKEKLSPKQMNDLLNQQSGLIGISGVSSDLRDVEKAAAQGNKRAKLSEEVLVYQIKKYIGAYSAAMGGIDALVFTAGIGENAVDLRKCICNNMEYLGICIDPERNGRLQKGKEGLISLPDAKVKVYVIPTNEEYMIALDTQSIVTSRKSKH